MRKKYHSKFHHGIMFHRFHKNGRKGDGAGSLNEHEFEKILKFIGLKNIISPSQWIEKIKNKSFKKNDICITLDDGLKSQYKYALPILEKYNLKAFWFIFSSVFRNNIDMNELYNQVIYKRFKSQKIFQKIFLKKLDLNKDIFKSKDYLKFKNQNKKLFSFFSKEDIKYRYVRNHYLTRKKFENIMNDLLKLKKKDLINAKLLWMNINDIKKINSLGHTIGMHSDTHNLNFKGLSPQKQKTEYVKNYKFLKTITKKNPISMSHPLNSYNKQTLKILKKMKIICGFRSTLYPKSKSNISCLEFARNDPTHILYSMHK